MRNGHVVCRDPALGLKAWPAWRHKPSVRAPSFLLEQPWAEDLQPDLPDQTSQSVAVPGLLRLLLFFLLPPPAAPHPTPMIGVTSGEGREQDWGRKKSSFNFIYNILLPS